MEQADFTLKSGAKLHLSMGPWELVENLYAEIDSLRRSIKDPEDLEKALLSSTTIRNAIINLYPWATYDNLKMYPGIFDEPNLAPKIRPDAPEIRAQMIEFHMRPFFLRNSSKSTDSIKLPTENQRQP